MFRTATNLVRDRHRVEKNRARLLEANPVSPTRPEAADRRVERTEEIAAVRRALDALNERDREMLLMKHEGFSYREIAAAVDVAATSVGTLLARAEARFVAATSSGVGWSGSAASGSEPSLRRQAIRRSRALVGVRFPAAIDS